MSDFVQHFPYSTIRDVQEQLLLMLEKEWDNYDVMVIVAPTATGKSAISKTLMSAIRSSSTITPTNLLVKQFQDEFPDTRSLARMDSYYCEEWQRPCASTRNKLMKYCAGCQCGRDIAVAKFQKGPGIYNYHIYMAHKLYRDVLIIDEAHNILPTIQDRLAIKLWQHDYKYPLNMYTQESTLAWIDSLSPAKKKTKKIRLLREACKYQVPEYIMERTKEWFSGKGTLRNEPEERDLIKLIPVDISQAPPMLWPQEVSKIIMMSATINKKDIERLGLSKKRILYIECASPIPPENRPIIFQPVTSISRANIDTAIPKLAEYIKQVAEYHRNEKGVIHATYQVASMLRDHLTDSRFMFHNRSDKQLVYQQFRNIQHLAPRNIQHTPTTESRPAPVLIACGLYEGIDLPEDAGRWQIISKIPWPSLGNPGVKHLSELDPEWYSWDTLKTVIQACGRVCRTPDDYGVSYIPDSSFNRLLKDAKHLMPRYFLDALNIV